MFFAVPNPLQRKSVRFPRPLKRLTPLSIALSVFSTPLSVILSCLCLLFFNAGILLQDIDLPVLTSNAAALGVFLGLLVGKPVGVVLFAYLATLTGVAQLPQNVRWRHIIAVGFLAGYWFYHVSFYK